MSKEQMHQRLHLLKEKACWHEAMMDEYRHRDESFGQAAAQRHAEMARACWEQYGRLLAEQETAEEWQVENVVYLQGRVLQ